ncbi:MAG: TetR family transcriptional regulator [Pseudonocardia sp.]
MAFTERSRASREAVLGAARRTFAERGYERTTVRLVAADAGVDPSMVIRYFGSKDGLFAAAMQVDLRLPELAEVPADCRGEVLAWHFLELWEGEQTGEVLVVLLRSATTNDVAAARLREVFAGQVVALVAGLDPALPAPEVARRAGLISTQMLGTALTRYVLCLPPVVELTREEVVAALAPNLQSLLASTR